MEITLGHIYRWHATTEGCKNQKQTALTMIFVMVPNRQ